MPSADRLEPGTNPPDEINIVIEIPKDSNLKYEMDAKSGEIFVDRILVSAMFYPLNYGFIPQTRESGGTDDDKLDPVDVFILGNYSFRFSLFKSDGRDGSNFGALKRCHERVLDDV